MNTAATLFLGPSKRRSVCYHFASLRDVRARISADRHLQDDELHEGDCSRPEETLV